MTMVMISPSRREVSPAEQLCRSSRLDPPRFRLVAAESRPEKFPFIFSHRKTSYRRRWASESHQGAHEVGGAPRGGAPPTLVSRVWAPWPSSLATIFIYLFEGIPWSFRTFGVAQNRPSIFAPFPAQNSSCRHSPSSCKPCKIRENSHKHCDIT